MSKDQEASLGQIHHYNHLLNALGNDYISICLIDVDTKKVKLIKAFEKLIEQNNQEYDYYQMCEHNIQKYALNEEKEKIEEQIQLDHVLSELLKREDYSFICDILLKGVHHDCQVKYVLLDNPNQLIMGFRYVDDVILAKNEKKDEHNQEVLTKLEKNSEELKKERMFLDVLCKDYTSVYYLDLKHDSAEVIKVADEAHATKMFSNESRKAYCYSKYIQLYASRFVSEFNRTEFLYQMNLDHIIQSLKKADRFIYRYQSVPNLSQHCYFEIQVVLVQNEGFEDTALLAFRHIDDIITAEQKYQQDLEEALQKEKLSNEVLKAISKIYYAIFRIDLQKDTYEEIASDDTVHHLTGKTGKASFEMQKLCKSIVIPEYQERIMEFFDLSTLADRLENEETIAQEYLAQDGNWHTARFIVKRRDEKGRVSHVLYVTRLISDEKRKEQNWIAIAKEANKANEAKTVFLRRMSHDIRTPINGILGMLEMENRHKEDIEKLQECRDKIYDVAQYLLSIVNNVLDISKVEAGGIILEHKPFDLIDLLVKQFNVVSVQASENGIHFHGGKEMSTIKHRYLIGSPDHLNRALMNLSNNGIKYNRRGGDLILYCKELDASDNYAIYQFICQDTGRGMSKEFQKHAFEPFSQEGLVPLSSYNGSGLGLSIVKEIIEQMKGTIELESEEGKGTKFILTIPFEIDPHASTSLSEESSIPAINLSGYHALLVEDNALNQEIAKMILEDEGILVDCVNNGKEALEAFEKSKVNYYDFILMDVMMPVMDGIEATRLIRKSSKKEATSISIIGMSANAFQDDIYQSLQAGMSDYITKPLDIKKVKQTLQQVAYRKQKRE